MTEDSTNDSAFSAATALAEQCTSDNNIMEIVNPETTAQPVTDAALPGISNINISLVTRINNFTVDSEWRILPQWAGYHSFVTDGAVYSPYSNMFCWKDIPVGYLCGSPHALEMPTTDTLTKQPGGASNIIRWCDSSLDYYAWNKLNSFNLHLKNFQFLVERDASGGIQLKDNPVFEVMFLPVLPVPDTRTTEDTTVDPLFFETGNVIQTDLKSGIHIQTGCRSGWGVPADMYYNSGGTSPRWIHRSVYEWGFKSYGSIAEPIQGITDATADWNTKLAYIPRGVSYNPFSICMIRMINAPTNTNIITQLSFEIELTANWSAMFKSIRYFQTTMNHDGSVAPNPNAKKEENIKKRKLIERLKL